MVSLWKNKFQMDSMNWEKRKKQPASSLFYSKESKVKKLSGQRFLSVLQQLTPIQASEMISWILPTLSPKITLGMIMMYLVFPWGVSFSLSVIIFWWSNAKHPSISFTVYFSLVPLFLRCFCIFSSAYPSFCQISPSLLQWDSPGSGTSCSNNSILQTPRVLDGNFMAEQTCARAIPSFKTNRW